MNTPVKHYLCDHARDAWKLGFVGFLTRMRGLVGTLLLTLLTMGAPFWWRDTFSRVVSIDLALLFAVSTVVMGIAFWLAFRYLRRRSQRSLKIKFFMHRITEYARDSHAAIGSQSNLSKEQALEKHLQDYCQILKEYFRTLSGDDTLEICIRVAEESNGAIAYRTYARSTGLSPGRAKTSQPIPIDQGVPAHLIRCGGGGVMVYTDIPEAVKLKLFFETNNERDYPSEIASMAVAPLNYSNIGDSKRQLIGLLHLTSRHHKPLDVNNLDAVGFAADILALSLGRMTKALAERGVHP